MSEVSKANIQQNTGRAEGVERAQGAQGAAEENANLRHSMTRNEQIRITKKVAAGELSNERSLPTYLYYGHGRDILVTNPDYNGQWMGDYNHEPIPEDCILVSFSAPGISTYRPASMAFRSNIRTKGFVNKLLNPFYFFNDLSEANRISNEYLKRIIPQEDFNHLRLSPKKPGDFYAETTFTPFAVFKILGSSNYELYTSGIYDVRDNTAKIFDPASDAPVIMENGFATLEAILTKFDGSIFPTVQDIIEATHYYPINPEHVSIQNMEVLIMIVKKKYEVNKDLFLQSDLFRLFPGIHYVTACRYMDEDKDVSASLPIARTLSSNRRKLLLSLEEINKEKVSKILDFFQRLQIRFLNNLLLRKKEDNLTEKFKQEKKETIREIHYYTDTFMKQEHITFDDFLLIPQNIIDEQKLDTIESSEQLREAIITLFEIIQTLKGGKRKETVKKRRSSKYKSKKRR